MADIFLSYAREDLEQARWLAEALHREGWSVFWDRTTPPGVPWDEYIEDALDEARCVVVVWSRESVRSRWVREEARHGLDQSHLLPVVLDGVERLPLGFRSIQAENLAAWDGSTDKPEYQNLVGALSTLLGAPEPKASEQGERPVEQPLRMDQDGYPAGWPQTLTTENGGVDLVLVPGGTFPMGSPEDEEGRRNNEGPVHEVIVQPFYIGRYLVTNDEYTRFMAAVDGIDEPQYWSDRSFSAARQPVVGVTWQEARRFAEWIGGRLPTEAEWELAARAGTTTWFWWGDEPGKNRANFDGSGAEWSGKKTSPVDAFEPNPFGLYDVHGNVWEWVADCWHDTYHGAPADGSVWLEAGGGDCAQRVLRGGSWAGSRVRARAAHRLHHNFGVSDRSIGFRVAMSSSMT